MHFRSMRMWSSADRGSLLFLIVFAPLICSLVASADEGGSDEELVIEPETIDMTPDDPVGWSLRNVAAPITAAFKGGLGYWYDEREIRVDTTPSGGFVDLFYVRKNFQKRFEQAESPVIVVLPPRIKAGPRDALKIRAFREGFRQESVTLPVSSRQTEVLINLDPLPNSLVALSHRYFAGRSSLVFLTKESASVRLQEARGGFTLILSETAKSSEASAALDGIRSPMLARAFAQQLGEDLVVKVEYTPTISKEEIQVRSREERNAARDLYLFSLDVMPAVGSGGAVAAAKAALAELKPSDVRGCALEFDAGMHDGLDAGALSRALTPRGAFTDPYLRAAMRRLGELSANDGLVEFSSGVSYRPTVPIELEAALSQAGEATGYLALLRSFVSKMEKPDYERETYRSLIAPELDPKSFGVIMDRAIEREQGCLASS